MSLQATTSLDRHLSELRGEHLARLSELVPTYKRGPFLFMHGTPESCEDYLMNDRDIRDLLERHPLPRVFFAGHLHIPRIAFQRDGSREIEFTEVNPSITRAYLDFERHRYVINCPAVNFGRFGYRNPGACTIDHVSGTRKLLTFLFWEESPPSWT